MTNAEELSTYELLRLETIEWNQHQLRAFGLAPESPEQTKAPGPVRRGRKQSGGVKQLPTRFSARLPAVPKSYVTPSQARSSVKRPPSFRVDVNSDAAEV
jgi:hypothetical protein